MALREIDWPQGRQGVTQDPGAGKWRRTCKRSFLDMMSFPSSLSFQLPWIMKFGERSKNNDIFECVWGGRHSSFRQRSFREGSSHTWKRKEGKIGKWSFPDSQTLSCPQHAKGAHIAIIFSAPICSGPTLMLPFIWLDVFLSPANTLSAF